MATTNLGRKNDHSGLGNLAAAEVNGIADDLERLGYGYSSIAHTDAATLTLTTAQDQYPILNITGALTAARNLVVRTAAGAQWLVRNSTTGGFGVTVKTAAGTGILIPAGETALLYGDGTNIVRAVSAAATPNSASYLTLATHADLTSERVLTAGAGITLTDAGAGSTLTIAASGAAGSLTASGIAVAGTSLGNSTVETTIYTKAVAANAMVAGTVYAIRLQGYYNAANGTDTLTFRFKIAGNTFETIATTAAAAANAPVNMLWLLTIRTIGATGTIALGVEASLNNVDKCKTTVAPATINTTATADLTVTAQWSNALVGNAWFLEQAFCVAHV